MRKGTVADQCDWFKVQLDDLERLATRLLGEATTPLGKRWIAKMMALEAWSLFSSFAEWVLYCSVNNDSGRLRETTGLSGIPKHLNLDTVNALFTLERGYFDFRSYEELAGIGKKYISKEEAKNPFKKVIDDDAKLIEQLAKIRNRIAHESRKSRRSYDSMMREAYKYDRVPAPDKFLASGSTRGPRLLDFFDALRRAALSIKT